MMKRSLSTKTWAVMLAILPAVSGCAAPPPPEVALEAAPEVSIPQAATAPSPKAAADMTDQSEWELPGWELTWHDEFDGPRVDTKKWELQTRKKNHNNEKQYYIPEQAATANGELVITATNEPLDGKLYRSARMFSWFSQAYGRFEARAKVPTTKGIWPAFWLVPRTVQWPHGGEIDIMEHAGSKPTKIGTAYHYQTGAGNHTYQNSRYQPDPPVYFAEDYHTYAVEWDPGQIKFFIDGVCHKTVTDFYVSNEPMSFILNTAVGGWYDGDPDETTVFPQTFHVDYVRAWKRTGPAPKIEARPHADTGLLVNGGFDVGFAPWVAAGHTRQSAHRETTYAHSEAVEGLGYYSVKMWSDSKLYQEGIKVQPGKTYRVALQAQVYSDDTIHGTGNTVKLSVDFFNERGRMLKTGGSIKQVIADGDVVEDQWFPVEASGTAPEGAVTARVMVRFHPAKGEKGAVWIDAVSMHEVAAVPASEAKMPVDATK